MSTLFLCLLASSRRPFRALKMRPVRQVLLLARHASENASRAAGGCPQSVESAVLRAFENAFGAAGAVLRAFEDASRTVGALFWHRISLPYRRSLFFTPNASENASRTTGACFAHRVSLPYHRRAFPVPSPQGQAAAAAELRASTKERGRLKGRPRSLVLELRNRFEIILLQPEL